MQQVIVTNLVQMKSVSAERTFSALKRIKTYLRNTMHQERLSNLAIIHIEKEITSKLSKAKIAKINCKDQAKINFVQ